MKWRDWLEKWGLTAIKFNVGFAELEFQPNDADRKAAWELYVELLTRTTTQPLPDEHGDEHTALVSVVSLFSTTREILKENGSGCIEFSKIAVVVLNQVVRPFTTEWHRRSLAGDLKTTEGARDFRKDLAEIQAKLRIYTKMLADMAAVEDLTTLAEFEGP